MDWKLPTDNLYKFIALSGVATFLFGVYGCDQIDQERSTRLLAFNTQEHDRLEKMESLTRPWMPAIYNSELSWPNLIEYDTENKEERKEWNKGVDDVLNFHRGNISAPNKKQMEAYFTRENVKYQF